MNQKQCTMPPQRLPRMVGVVFLALCTFFLFPRATSAAEPGACDFRSYLDRLGKIQTSASDEQQRLVGELKVRKQLLAAIIDCSVSEAETLQEELGALTPANEDAAQIIKSVLRNLETSSDYFTYQKTKIPDLGLRGTKEMARELLSWRVGTHNALKEAASNFTIWNGNQPLFRVAEERLSALRRTVRVRSEDFNEAVRTLLLAADENLRRAKGENTKATLLLRGYGNTQDTLAAIRSSLEALGAMYENFFELNRLLR
jgi:hypothetical protein